MKIAASDPRWKVAEGNPNPNLPRLERIMASLEKEVRQMKYSLEKYKSDPRKYEPQLDNVALSADVMGSDVRVLLRTLGKE